MLLEQEKLPRYLGNSVKATLQPKKSASQHNQPQEETAEIATPKPSHDRGNLHCTACSTYEAQPPPARPPACCTSLHPLHSQRSGEALPLLAATLQSTYFLLSLSLIYMGLLLALHVYHMKRHLSAPLHMLPSSPPLHLHISTIHHNAMQSNRSCAPSSSAPTGRLIRKRACTRRP